MYLQSDVGQLTYSEILHYGSFLDLNVNISVLIFAFLDGGQLCQSMVWQALHSHIAR